MSSDESCALSLLNYMLLWRAGVKYIRGAVIYEVRDEENVVLNDFAR